MKQREERILPVEQTADGTVEDISPPKILNQTRDPRFWVVLLLASQYLLFQLIWPVTYQDAARNLHWGIYLTEEPRFLLDVEDVYDRTYGFPPEDPAEAPAGLTRDQGTWFHGWWGPIYPIIIGGLWLTSRSYTLLELFTPICAGLIILLTYLFGAQYFNRRIGFTAALLLAITPVFREHAVLAYTEPVGALLLLSAFWSHLRRNSLLTVVFGTLSVLMKIDMIFLYLGTIALTEWMYWREKKEAFSPGHAFASLGIPGIFTAAWLILNYGITNRPMTVLGAPGIDNLIQLAPPLIDQFFTTIPLLTYITLGVMVFCIGLGLMQRNFASLQVYRLLGIWSGLGIIVLIVYMFFPGASNNPRILIPTFPGIFLLIAAGVNQLKLRPRMLVESYLIVILVMMSVVGVLYQKIYSEEQQAGRPVWEWLRDEPKGHVMSPDFWQVNLYARQPATWFLGDPVYEHSILHDLDNFQNYLEDHPIRYVVLPLEDDTSRQFRSPDVQLYQAMGIGRRLNLRSEPIASDDVRAYLEEEYPELIVGEYVIFRIW